MLFYLNYIAITIITTPILIYIFFKNIFAVGVFCNLLLLRRILPKNVVAVLKAPCIFALLYFSLLTFPAHIFTLSTIFLAIIFTITYLLSFSPMYFSHLPFSLFSYLFTV